nr:ribosomal protein S4 [Cavernulicola chilensis]
MKGTIKYKTAKRKFQVKDSKVQYKISGGYPEYLYKKSGPKKLYNLSRNEKQKVKLYYKINERCFRNTLKQCYKQDSNIAISFLKNVELRLDIILYRSELVHYLTEARQQIGHGIIKVNGIRVKKIGRILEPGDVVHINDKFYYKRLLNIKNESNLPLTKYSQLFLKIDLSKKERGGLNYFVVNSKALAIKIIRMPNLQELDILCEPVLPPYFRRIKLNVETACAYN